MRLSATVKHAFLNLIHDLENNDFERRSAMQTRFIHSTLGLTTEVAELVVLIDSAHTKDINDFRLEFKDEIGDIIWYLLQGQDIDHGSLSSQYDKIDIKHGTYLAKLVVSVGEVADILKKYLVGNQDIDPDKLNNWYENIWRYLVSLVDEYDIDVDECVRVTSAKLNYRYSEGVFRYQDRVNRNRDEEKKIMGQAEND